VKLYQVDFEYTEHANVPNVIANTPEEAEEGARKLVGTRVKNPKNFVAVEQDAPELDSTDQTIN
jgi:hypothetical protein